MSYTAPVKDIAFALEHVVGLADIVELDGFDEATLAQLTTHNPRSIFEPGYSGNQE